MAHTAMLMLLVAVTRTAFRSHFLYDIDSVNFALGMRRFDPAAHQPHPPGYFLYILLGRAMNLLFHDANTALVAIGIAASCGAVLMIYLLASDWFGQQAAIFAGLIFLVSPLAWFHGTVALTYVTEAFFSSLTGYLLWRVYAGSARFILPAAIVMGVAAGFRPSFLLFLSPLLLCSVVFAGVRVSRGWCVAGAGALALTVAAWFFPMLSASGGFAAYRSSLLSLWRIAPAKNTVFNSNPAISVARLITIGGIYLLCFGFAALLTFRRGRAAEPRTRAFMAVWVAPGLLFFSLIFLRFVNSGYLLVISPPLFAWLGGRASEWYADPHGRSGMRAVLVVTCAAANVLVFLFAPVYCSYSAVRHFEAELRDVVEAIPRVASPEDTMILGFDNHFLGYRHAGYYLPEWYTAQYPEVRLERGLRVFVMEHGDTRLAAKLPEGRFKKFIFFPLPSDDDEYRVYMARIRARFPPGVLRTVKTGGRELVLGPVAELPRLFPTAAKSVDLGGAVVPVRRQPAIR